MIISRCEDCNHRDICKHKDEYSKVINDINVKVPEPFTLSLNCKHYYSTNVYLGSTGYYNDYSNTGSTNNNLEQYLYKPHPGQP